MEMCNLPEVTTYDLLTNPLACVVLLLSLLLSPLSRMLPKVFQEVVVSKLAQHNHQMMVMIHRILTISSNEK